MAGIFLLTACTVPPPPQSLPTDRVGEAAGTASGLQARSSSAEQIWAPLPPFRVDDLGGGLAQSGEIDGMLEALRCMAEGQPIYALARQNATLRAQPSGDGCVLGQVSPGSLVRVEGIFAQADLESGEQLPLVSLDRRSPTTWLGIGASVGYEEDILPIFQQNCAACHGELLQIMGLQVTEYDTLMAGSANGSVVTPGDAEDSLLWRQVASGAMPVVGELSPEQKRAVFDWIQAGAPPQRDEAPTADGLWLRINSQDLTINPANNCDLPADASVRPFVEARLFQVASCAAAPSATQLAALRRDLPAQSIIRPAAITAAGDDAAPDGEAAESAQVSGAPAPAAPAIPAPTTFSPATARIQVAPLSLPAPANSDPWMTPRGGFCVEQRLPSLQDSRGITSLAFAPDGRLFIGLDDLSTGAPDPNIFFDAFHPSRSIAVYDSIGGGNSYGEILTESSRITDMTWHGGSLYLNRAGEVGRIPDGGSYQRLAGGFAVNGRLFHANNGIAIVDGWLYVSAGGMRDGYSDGIINPESSDPPAETVATNIAAEGNPYAARIVRAPLNQLVTERSISLFQTAVRGVRNPYGMSVDPFGRIWFTDNGATNVGPEYLAGDEVNLFDPRTLSPAAAAGDENATPFYGFPIALSGNSQPWYTEPVLPLLNATAPTGITWAYNTIFFAQYGRDAGLYRMANANGQIVAERILLAWPIQAVTTAPDGAIWIGTGGGGLYRLSPGCQ